MLGAVLSLEISVRFVACGGLAVVLLRLLTRKRPGKRVHASAQVHLSAAASGTLQHGLHPARSQTKPRRPRRGSGLTVSAGEVSPFSSPGRDLA